MTPARIASPLPECDLCGRPTVRDVHASNGGLCSACAREAAAQVLFVLPRHLARPGGDQ